MRDHVILCGLGRVGRRVLELLRTAGESVVVIDNKADPAEERSDEKTTFLRGDFRRRELLEQAGLADARGAIIVTSDDLANLSSLMTMLQVRPGLRVVVRMFNPDLVSRLGPVTANVFALSASALTAPMLALLARTGSAVAAFSLSPQMPMAVSAWPVPVDSPLIGKTLGEVAETFELRVVSHARAAGETRYLSEVDPKSAIEARDRIVVAGPMARVETLVGGTAELSALRRGGFVRRLWRTAIRIFAEIDWPVKVCATIFFTVIILSVLVFRFGMKNDTTIDAFFRTISLLATGADMHREDVEEGSWQKAFIGFLRLIGTGLTAAFTAIFTNYLVRAHLRGALEVRRIPEGGHVVVAGLGNVGFRVVEELIRRGERVVAIERRGDNAFIATARRLGAAVIVGDTTVIEVLRQAHAASAKSIVAATQNELTNLEVGLLVRQLHPKKRVVLRLIDSQLAQLLRNAAQIRLAVSIPELAAPAFLAGLFGDRVRTVFYVEEQLFAVVDLAVTAGSALEGRCIGELATTHRLLPMAVTSNAMCDPKTPETRILKSGDTLTAVLSFRDLPELFQRETGRRAAL
jgi:Trk K+ transport system NAD-binding subunit